MESKVYIGTYAKYNSGDLSGSWITLNDCKDYKEFLERCKAAHPDESDPEFMVQDVDNIPEGLDCLEWLTEKDFNDIKQEISNESAPESDVKIIDYSEKAIAVIGNTKPIKDKLKAAGGRFNAKLSCGAGWIFPKAHIDKVTAIVGNNNMDDIPESSCGQDYKKNANEFLNRTGDKYWASELLGAVMLSNGYYLLLDKKHIENKFCFYDEGPDYDLYCSLVDDKKKLEKYFINKNIGDLENDLNEFRSNPDNFILMADVPYMGACKLINKDLYQRHYYRDDKKTFSPSPKDVKSIVGGLQYQYDKFKKRLDTYLKKYGTEKIRMWTFWRDA